MERFTTPKGIALFTTILFLGSILWLLNTQRINNSLENELNGERLTSEKLLSEKLLLQKDIDKFKMQLATMSGKNQELDKILSVTSSKLAIQESAYNKLTKENASLKQVKKQRDDLLALNTDMDARIEGLNITIATLQQENADIGEQVALLQQRNRLLSEELTQAMLASVDYTQVQSLKGTKLVIKASQTKKLVANFEVPGELKNLSYHITDPSGKVIPSGDGTIASRIVGVGSSYIASSSENGAGSVTSKIEMTYIPGRKLKPGLYKIEILNDNLYVGSLQVKLK